VAKKKVIKVLSQVVATRGDSSVSPASRSPYRLLDIFLNADFRNRHEGLSLLAKTRNIDVSRLEPGHFVVFVNSAKSTVWLYAANGVLSGRKLPKGETLDLRSIRYIVDAFRATGRFEYDEAMAKVVTRYTGHQWEPSMTPAVEG
jgi:hypothetical protein